MKRDVSFLPLIICSGVDIAVKVVAEIVRMVIQKTGKDFQSAISLILKNESPARDNMPAHEPSLTHLFVFLVEYR